MSASHAFDPTLGRFLSTRGFLSTLVAAFQHRVARQTVVAVHEVYYRLTCAVCGYADPPISASARRAETGCPTAPLGPVQVVVGSAMVCEYAMYQLQTAPVELAWVGRSQDRCQKVRLGVQIVQLPGV